MKSRANLKGHPIHPMLIPFPIAFLIGALLFDIIGTLKNDEVFWLLGKYLSFAGIISALAAAVPGVIDYLFTVPPESSAKKRATKHGLVNLGAVFLFSIALFLRNESFENAATVIGIESLGAIMLFTGGWLGGTLSYRNQIGVDQRYANSGKWNELTLEQRGAVPLEVSSADELKVNQMKLLKINGKRIVLARTEQGYTAFDDRCTHKGGSLAGGIMICGTVHCPWHGSLFDVNTGAVKSGPAKDSISTYKVMENGGKIYLNL